MSEQNVRKINEADPRKIAGAIIGDFVVCFEFMDFDSGSPDRDQGITLEVTLQKNGDYEYSFYSPDAGPDGWVISFTGTAAEALRHRGVSLCDSQAAEVNAADPRDVVSRFSLDDFKLDVHHIEFAHPDEKYPDVRERPYLVAERRGGKSLYQYHYYESDFTREGYRRGSAIEVFYAVSPCADDPEAVLGGAIGIPPDQRPLTQAERGEGVPVGPTKLTRMNWAASTSTLQ